MIKEIQTLQRVGNETTLGHIYKITNLINGKIYIGQTIQSIKDRWYRHVGNSKWLSQHEVNMAIKRAIRKYGKENFKLELIENCKRENLNDRENIGFLTMILIILDIITLQEVKMVLNHLKMTKKNVKK